MTTTITMMHRISWLWMATLVSTTTATLAEPDTSHPVLSWLSTVDDECSVSSKIGYSQGNLIALQDIEQGEMVLNICPQALLYDEENSSECATAALLAREYQLGDASAHGPYVQYVFHNFDHGSLPTAWSTPALELAQTLIGGELGPQYVGQGFGRHAFAAQCGPYQNYVDDASSTLPSEETLLAALRIVASRGWHHVLVPVFDMINHRNDALDGHDWHNVDRFAEDEDTLLVPQGDPYHIVALRRIPAGTPLHNSYNQCPNDITCHDIEWSYVTPHIFNDYGFVENMPQRWRFNDNEENAAANDGYLTGLAWELDYNDSAQEYKVTIVQVMDEDEEDDEEEDEEEERVQPADLPLAPSVLNALYNHFRRVQAMGYEDSEWYQAVQKDVSDETERSLLLQYQRALTTALEQVYLAGGASSSVQDMAEHQCVKASLDSDIANEETLPTVTATTTSTTSDTSETVVRTTHDSEENHLSLSSSSVDGKVACPHYGPDDATRTYHSLDPNQVTDDLNYQFHVAGGHCQFEGYRPMKQDSSSSRYSRLLFDHSYNAKDQTWDSCLMINEWLQSCTTFRPHYHELVVHYPASFVDDVRRVLFLGGGDIMIMHEILKYPNLELVLGLELDQQVLRTSYRNTGIQPHFDHPAVHWAFGDATKSLLMIPESWYGTFDLVIVDLQNFVFDTVMVTQDLTIMDMAMKMVAPQGVISRNDDFVRRRNMEFAKYVVDIELHDVPRLCQQSMTMGSNGIDFLTKKPKNHGLDTVFFDPVHRHNSTFWTNYRNHGDTYKGSTVPDPPTRADSDDTCQQAAAQDALANTAHGVLVVMEAENVSLPMSVVSLVRANLQQAMVNLGFTMLDYTALKSVPNNMAVLIFEEGYVAARTFPEHKYCALDLMLWSSFDKQHEAMKALVAAVGGDYNRTTSTYSNVASGIYGLSKKDSGDQECQPSDTGKVEKETPVVDSKEDMISSLIPLGQGDLKTVLGEMSTNLMHGQDSSVWVVLCSAEGKSCPSLDAMRFSHKNVFPVWTCANLAIVNSTKQGSEEHNMALVECERSVRRTLLEVAGQIGGLVLDASVPTEMGQVLHKILDSTNVRHELMGQDFVLLSVVQEDWSQALLELVRASMVKFNPIFHVESTVTSSSTNDSAGMSLGILSSGDKTFYVNLMAALEQVERMPHLKTEVLDSKAGVVSYIPDFELSKRVTTDDYDLADSKRQWHSQKPLAHQSIYRFEIQLPPAPLQVGDDVLYNEEAHVWYGVWFGAKVVTVHPSSEPKQELTYDVKDIYGRVHSNVERGLLRKMETAASTSHTFKFGDRVLLHLNNIDGYSDVWYQASVTGHLEDGRYMLQPFSDDYGEFFASPKDMVPQFEAPDASLQSKITIAKLKGIVNRVVSMVPDVYEDPDGEEEETEDKAVMIPVGDGYVLAALWSPGSSLILTWDGKTRLDVNFFDLHMVDKNDEDEFRTDLESLILESVDYLAVTSLDEQPRGIGRIVNNQAELDSFWFGELDDFRAKPVGFAFKPSLE